MSKILNPVIAPNLTSKHGFFSREGGISKQDFQGLNAGIGSGDDEKNIVHNRGLIATYLGVENEYLLNGYQTHSSKCLTVSTPSKLSDRPKVDALVTDQKGLGIGVLTADCVPVLLEGKKENGDPVIGAAHAGWKGALGGVLIDTVHKMEELECNVETIKAAIGPSIQQASYEVGVDLFELFLKEGEENEHFFLQGKDLRHFQLDLPGYVAKKLALLGLKDVYIAPEDTYALEDRFFSYRRSTHKGEKEYGRQLSAIVID